MMTKKLKSITPDELKKYGDLYNISLTTKQAEAIISYLRKTDLDPLSEKDRITFFKKLAEITNIETAQKAQRLFVKLIKQYGVESWFK